MKTRSNTLTWIAVILFATAIVFDIAYAGGDEIIQSNDMNAQTAGDLGISTRGGIGVSQALGDVDINDCLASTQWGIPVIFAKQKVQENPWCMANSLDAMGAHIAAAKVRCTTETIKAIYPDPEICEQAVMWSVVVPQNISYNGINEKFILQMWESSSLWAENLRDLSRSLYEALEKAESDVSGAEEKGQLSELRGRLSEAGKVSEVALREVWFAGLTDASPELLKTVRRNLVLSQMSSGSPRDRDDEDYKRLYARITDLEAMRVQDKDKAEKAAKRANAMAQRVQTQQPIDDGSSRRAEARDAYLKALEEDQ